MSTAVVGAGIVAIGAGAALPNATPSHRTAYTTDDPARLSELSVDDRQAAQDRANRAKERPDPAFSVEQAAPDVWLLPLHNQYRLTTLFEMRWGEMHTGLDFAAGWGTPYYAVHSGTVTLARWNGGYGYNIQIDHGDGVTTVYGHSSKLLVTEGQHVEAGQVIGLVGDTGYSFGDHLHFEVRVDDKAIDPIPFMLARGVDVRKHLEAANGGLVIS